VVGLCVERSPALLVGLLGILKAGGAYLPLDPDYPAPRLAFMLAKLYNTSASRFQRETRGGPRRRAEESHGNRLG
jgi:acyl-CoA synthetase (AMP-forming)/AMP-acid ligase II